MKKLVINKQRSLVALIALVIAAGQLVACGGSQMTPDDYKEALETDETQLMANEMGIERQALESFQEAIAELEREKPDAEKAERLLLEVIEAEPEFAEAHYNLGVLYSERSRHDEAVAHLEKAREIEPDDLDHTGALAQAYANTDNYRDARRLFKEVVTRQPENLTAKNNLAVLALKEGDDEMAMEHVRDVLKEDYEDVGALNTLGLIHKNRGNYSLAKFAFGEAIKLSEDDPDPDVHNNLGLVYMDEEDIPNAVAQFEKANEADPNYLESRLNLGAILIEYLDYDRAAETFAEATRIAPRHCVARLGLGASTFGQGEYEESVENFEYYVDECDSGHISSHERLATLYETRLQDYEKAIAHYEALLDLVDDEDRANRYQSMVNFLENQLEAENQKEPEEPAGEDVEAEETAEEDVEELDEEEQLEEGELDEEEEELAEEPEVDETAEADEADTDE